MPEDASILSFSLCSGCKTIYKNIDRRVPHPALFPSEGWETMDLHRPSYTPAILIPSWVHGALATTR